MSVLRGGSWNNNQRNVRVANRNRNDPDNRNNNVGFRCARLPSKGESRIRMSPVRGLCGRGMGGACLEGERRRPPSGDDVTGTSEVPVT